MEVKDNMKIMWNNKIKKLIYVLYIYNIFKYLFNDINNIMLMKKLRKN